MPAPTIIPERLEIVRGIIPAVSNHPAPAVDCDTPRGCEMELISWTTGLPWADSLECVSSPIGAFLRAYNDSVDDDARAKMHAHVLDNLERILATGGDGQDEARGWLAADWQVRHATPTWLELAGINDAAAALRALPPVIDLATLQGAQPALTAASTEAAAARAAARDAARDAAWAAAWDAAWDAAVEAPDGEKYDATYAATKTMLAPTVLSLQESAHELLTRMIDPSSATQEAGER